jgi:hypothetical protein
MRGTTMRQDDNSTCTDRPRRHLESIEADHGEKCVSPKIAEARAWATVNEFSSAGPKDGSGRNQN